MFMATASVSWVSREMEPRDMAPEGGREGGREGVEMRINFPPVFILNGGREGEREGRHTSGEALDDVNGRLHLLDGDGAGRVHLELEEAAEIALGVGLVHHLFQKAREGGRKGGREGKVRMVD